ncbi:MAG: hypothetical protein JWM19_7000 [Actinomycetia bacterium]|nr:hypothetical protein [Actinomycetes bacterium]
MSRKLDHPAPTTLARLRAGLPGGRRGRRLSAHIARCPACARVCAQLDSVSATLREAPRPPLPAAIERRILVAMTAEAARPQAGHPGVRRRARLRPSVPFSRLLPLIAAPAIAGALTLCAGFGYLLSTTRTSPPSPAPIAGPPASRTARSAPPGIGRGDGPSAAERSRPPAGRVTTSPASGASHTTAFLVTDSNITYQKATLGTQVRHTLAVQKPAPVVQQVQPSAAPTTILTPSPPDAGASPVLDRPAGGSTSREASTAGQVPPSRALVGCVLRLTGDMAPMFVDRATYQSEQVYVIAVDDEAWVVGIGCTASRPTLITSVQFSSGR